MNGVRAPEAAYPSFLTALGLFILSQAIAVVVTWLLTRLPVVGDAGGLDVAGTAAGYALVLAYALSRTGRSLGEVLPMRRIGPTGLVAVLASTSGLLVLQWVMNALVVTVLPVPAWFDRLYDELFTGGFVLGLARVALVAPVGEELLMRGIFLAGFVRRYGSRRAIVLSALVFALAHANPWQAVPAFLAGLLFGWWTLRAASLVPALVAHVAGNAAIFAGSVAPERFPALAEGADGRLWPPLEVAVSGALLLVCGLWLSARVFGPRVPYHVRGEP